MAQSDLDVIITATSNVKDVVGGLIKQVADLKTSLSGMAKEGNDATKAYDGTFESLSAHGQESRIRMDEEKEAFNKANVSKKKGLSEEEQALADVSKAQKEAAKVVKDSEKAMKDAAKAAEKLHDDLVKSGDGATILRDFLKGLVTGAIAATAALFAMHEVIAAFKFAIHEAAREQELTTSLDALSTSAGYSAAKVNETVASVESFGVSGEQARQSLQRLIQSNIDFAKATELTATAQRLAVIAGTSTGDMLERIAFSVQRLSPRMLLQSGIVVNLEQAYKKYALTLGVSASTLDDTQKRLAFIAELTLQGAKATDIAIQSLGNYNSQARAFDLSVGNLGQSIGDALLPAVTEVVRVSTLFITNLKQIVLEATGSTNIMEDLRQAIENIGKVILFLTELFTPLIRAVVMIIDGWLKLANSTTGLAVIFGVLLAVLVPLFPILSVIVAVLFVLKSIGIDLGDVLDTIALGFRLLSLLAIEFAFTIVEKWEVMILRLRLAWNGWLRFWGSSGKAEADGIAANLNKQIKEIEEGAERRRAGFGATLKGGSDGAGESEKIVAARQKLITLNGLVVDSERDVAKAASDPSLQKAATAHYTAVKAQQVAQEELVRKLVEEQKQTEKLTKTRDEAAAAAKKEKEFAESAAGIQANLDKLLGETGKEVITTLDGIPISLQSMTQGSIDSTNELKKALSDFTSGAKKENGEIAVSFAQVRAGLLASFGHAKTLEDFTYLLSTVKDAGIGVESVVKRFGENVAFTKQKVALSQLNAELVAYIAQVESLKSLQTLYNQLVQDGATHALAMSQIQAEVTHDKQAQFALELRGIAITYTAAQTAYQQEKVRIEDTRAVKLKAAKDESTDEENYAVRRKAANKEADAAIITNLKARYAASKTALDNYTAQYKKAVADRIAIEKAGAADIKSIEQGIRETKRSGMTDEQAQGDRRREVNEQQAEFEKAIGEKRYDDAKEINQRMLALAKEIESGPGDKDKNRAASLRIQQDALDNAKVLKAANLAVAVSNEERAKANVDAMELETEKIRQLLGDFAKEQLVKMRMEVDEASLTAAIDKIKSAFENVVVNVKAIIGGGSGASQQASGGLIPGNSTGVDDQLVLATSGEFMHPVRAVQHYGHSFMESVRNMTFPRYAMGGMIGEVGSKSVEHVSALDISFNKQALGRVRGSRETLRGLVSALKEVERGVK